MQMSLAERTDNLSIGKKASSAGNCGSPQVHLVEAGLLARFHDQILAELKTCSPRCSDSCDVPMSGVRQYSRANIYVTVDKCFKHLFMPWTIVSHIIADWTMTFLVFRPSHSDEALNS
jgi:hypothetical protein